MYKNIFSVFLFGLMGVFMIFSSVNVVNAAPFTDEEVKSNFNDFDENIKEIPAVKKIVLLIVKWVGIIGFGVAVVMSVILGVKSIKDPEKTANSFSLFWKIWLAWGVIMLIFLIANWIVAGFSTIVK